MFNIEFCDDDLIDTFHSLLNCNTSKDAKNIIDDIPENKLEDLLLFLIHEFHDVCLTLENKCLHKEMHDLLCDVKYRVMHLDMSKYEAYYLLNSFNDGISAMAAHLATSAEGDECPELGKQEHIYKCCSNCELECSPHCVYHDFVFE